MRPVAPCMFYFKHFLARTPPCIFFTDITKQSDKDTKICQLIGLVFDTIYKRRSPTTTTWPVASKMESKTNGKTYCAFHKHANSKSSKGAFTIAFFAAVNHNYDHKQRTLKHRNTQNGSKSTNHKSQSMTF